MQPKEFFGWLCKSQQDATFCLFLIRNLFFLWDKNLSHSQSLIKNTYFPHQKMIVMRYYGLMSYDYILPCCTTIAPNSYDYRMPCRTTWEPYKHDSSIAKIITLWFSSPFSLVLVFNICTQIIFSWKYRNFSKENIKRISRIVLAGFILRHREWSFYLLKSLILSLWVPVSIS